MAADLSIHVIPVDPITVEYTYTFWNEDNKRQQRTITKLIDESVLAALFSSSLGSKWFDLSADLRQELSDAAFSLIAETPQCWVGEVSWLKAALFKDEETFVPNTVAQVSSIIGEDLPVIDDQLIEKIARAFDAPNDTSYSLANKDEVVAFLEEHKGLRCFTASW